MTKVHYEDYDKEMRLIADYVVDKEIDNKIAQRLAKYCLMDSLGCAILATNFSACTKLLGPIVPQDTLEKGARVPGTDYVLDPVQAAFNNSVLIRWLDFNDAFLAEEWGHPSDNIGGLLAVADYLGQYKKKTITIKEFLNYIIKAHEIQGVMSLKNSFNDMGFDHVVLVKLATAAVATYMLGGNKTEVCAAQSQVWIDGPALRTYRHAPNVGARKSWAAGDASSRGVWLALMTMRGEEGYATALTAKRWGFYSVNFNNKSFEFPRPFDSYIMENILFKAYTAEYHAQTAVEAAIALHPLVKDRLDEIKKITIRTQESAMRIISKTGKLHNPADRDHCIQYMVAIGLIFGNLTATDFENERAKAPRIDELREKMETKEDKQFSKDYLDPAKRSVSNAVQVFFKDGSKTEEVIIEYPLGHPRNREQGLPLLEKKFRRNLLTVFSEEKANQLCELFEQDEEKLMKMSVNDFVQLWVKK